MHILNPREEGEVLDMVRDLVRDLVEAFGSPTICRLSGTRIATVTPNGFPRLFLTGQSFSLVPREKKG